MVQEKKNKKLTYNALDDDYESSIATKKIPESDPRTISNNRGEVFLSQETFGNMNLNNDDIDLRISRNDEKFTKRFGSENLRSELDTINREELNSQARD